MLEFLLGCPRNRSNTDLSPVPRSEATAEETKQIDEALRRIADLTEKFGHRREFRSLPIVVTTEDERANDRSAYCAGSYISLNRELFVSNKILPILQPVLLHEIGHCYFGLAHDNATISQPGYSIVFYKKDPVHPGVEYYSEVCATIMCAHGEIPGQLLEYYVGVLLGQPRATQVQSLKKYADFDLVPK